MNVSRSVLALGGVAPQVAAEPEILALAEPIIRADFRAYESWPTTPAPLDLPALAIGGSDDRLVLASQLTEWSRHLPRVRVEIVPGGHFFIQTHPDRVAALVSGLGDVV